ncbi:MAG: hypothetical protein INR62_13865 [Rhodospirillales bacterium]|nr:hypothetical protein [Acetobacter sp.]
MPIGHGVHARREEEKVKARLPRASVAASVGSAAVAATALVAFLTFLHPADLQAGSTQPKKTTPTVADSDTKADVGSKAAKVSAPTPTEQPAAPAAVVAAAPAAVPSAEPASVQHAVAARLTHCTPLIRQSVQFTQALPHSAALSSWAKDHADAHMFQSVMGLDYDSKIAPKAAAILVATPEAAGCEATFVQIQPTARACSDIEADLRKSGTTLADLSGLLITPDETPVKRMLLPVPGSGCVVVGVGLALNP